MDQWCGTYVDQYEDDDTQELVHEATSGRTLVLYTLDQSLCTVHRLGDTG